MFNKLIFIFFFLCYFFADTSTQNYFKNKTQTIRDAEDDDELSHLNDSGRSHHLKSMNHDDKRESSTKDKFIDIQQTNQKRPLTKKDSIDLDCEFEDLKNIFNSFKKFIF